MTNTQTTEAVDLGQEAFTATIDPAKVDAETLETLGRFLDDDDLEKLAAGESFSVTIHRGSHTDAEWQEWKAALLLAAVENG